MRESSGFSISGIVCWLLRSLDFHVNFKVGFSISEKNAIEI